MSDGLVHAELLAACSSLGYSDGHHYRREADCLETLRDLLRYLRKDGDSHEVRRALGDTRVMQTDLIPLLEAHGGEVEVAELVVRLMVDLTNPTPLLFREELPEEKVTRRHYTQLVAHQQGYKAAFTGQRVWEGVAGVLRGVLEVEKEDREEDHRLLLERVLVLMRNVLWAPASPGEGRTDDDASIHDQVLWAIHLSGAAEMLLYLAASPHEHDFSLHLLEILHHMLREQDAAALAAADLRRSAQEKDEDARQLEELRQQELLRRRARLRGGPSRHSRFGGTYVVRQVKGIGEHDLVVHRPLARIQDLSFDRNKNPRKHTKNRLPQKDDSTTRRSTLAVRMFLQELCVEFLAGAYNSVMGGVRDALDRSPGQAHDETHYLWILRFFTEFNRHHGGRVELVTETLTIDTFHFIQTHLESFHESMAMEKKKTALWSRRIHIALRAYQELLATLAHMDASPNTEVRESSSVLKSRMFYMPEYREMMMTLLHNYNPIKMSLGYLRDVVQATHTFIKLLEGMCKPGRHVMVQAKARARRAKKNKANKQTQQQPTQLTEDQLHDLWGELSPEVSSAVEMDTADLPFVMPFDPLAEEGEEVQKERAVRKIAQHLRGRAFPEAVSLLRAARDVFTEGDVFGPKDAYVTQDFLLLQEIFMANITTPHEPTPQQHEEEEEDNEEEEEEEEEERRVALMSEQEFDFAGFVRRFSSTKVVKAYSDLLHHYPTNTKHTNHCILKLFHRLAWDCKLPALFFQASLFIVFNKAMNDPTRHTSETPKEITKFAKYIMRQMYKVAEENPKVFVEMLFWKTNKEAVEIECGYGTTENVGKHKVWAEEEEEELRVLYAEVEKIPPEERGSKDIADLIMERLIRNTRNRRTVINKLKELGLIRDVKDLKHRPPRIFAPRQWAEEEEEELRRLFAENSDAMDVVGRVMDGLSIRRPKHRVVDKILELGLVSDRKELRKKRPKKAKGTTKTTKKSTGTDFLTANQPSDDEIIDTTSDSDSGNDDSEQDDERETAAAPTIPSIPVATLALISAALDVVLSSGRKEAVEWLARVLTDVADDREEDGDYEPVPILAITQACTDAMEDEDFHSLLRLVGLHSPLAHQEMFWRVPSKLSVAGLRKRAQYLSQGVAGGLLHVENPHEPLEPAENVEVVETETRKAKKTKKKRKNPLKVRKIRASSDDKENRVIGLTDDEDESGRQSTSRNSAPGVDSSDDDAPLSSVAPSSSQGGSAKRMLSDDDSEEDGPLGRRIKEKKKKGGSTNRMLSDDDSEDEGTLGRMIKEKKKGGSTKRMLSDDSEDEGTLGRMIEEKKKKKRIVLESDSEEEKEDEERGMEEEEEKRGMEEEEEKTGMEEEEKIRKKKRNVLESDSEEERGMEEEEEKERGMEEEEEPSQTNRKKRIRAIIDSDDE